MYQKRYKIEQGSNLGQIRAIYEQTVRREWSGNKMGLKIDYISDLHMGFVVGGKRSYKGKVVQKIANYVRLTLPETNGDVLVLAGDIDEYNTTVLYTFEEYANYYDKIFYVYGNHDLYLISMNQQSKYKFDSRNRQEELKASLAGNTELSNKVTILDNDVVSYKGLTIAGTMLWYTHPLTYDQIWWGMNSNDSRMIFPRGHEYSEERHQLDLEFYQSLEHQHIDLLITHIPPVHLNDKHKPNASYHNVAIADLGLNADHWICGHQHVRTIRQVGDTTIYVNAGGYPKELSGLPKIQSFTIQ